MEYYNSFVAGFDQGYRDGDFNKARFSDPCAIAFDTNGDRLFVADYDNHRIRVVYLNENNRVDTLAGSGVSGKTDGSLLQATFSGPVALAYLPQDALVVADGNLESDPLRYIDLKTKMVTTLAQTSQIYNLVYCEQNNSVYFSEPSIGAVQKLNLKTKIISSVISRNPLVPNPKALCINKNTIYVADPALPDVYAFDTNAAPASLDGDLRGGIGKGNNVFEMTYSDGILYALQTGSVPLARITPDYQPVSLATAWGYIGENGNDQAEPLFDFSQARVGFAASPKEKRKLYVSSKTSPSIISVKDYDFGGYWTTAQGDDFNYPTAKPQKTFRILMVGDSRLLLDPVVAVKTAWTQSYRVNTCAKQLEFWLNAEASLQNVDSHFEVLMLAHTNECPLIFSNYEVPDLAKKYDIDLVLLFSNLNFYDYFTKPLTSEGIPSLNDDAVFLAKPIESRIPAGPAGRFYQYCKKIGLLNTYTLNDWCHFLKLDDPEIRADMMEITGLPLRLLSHKLTSIKNNLGKSPQLAVLDIPWDFLYGPAETYDLFWKDLCRKNDVKLISLSEPFNLLKTSFYPTNQTVFARHYTAYGHELITFLLGHYLIEQKFIPFEPK